MARIEFKGKAFVRNHHLTVKYHELIPVKGKGLSAGPSLDDNLILHGDNLKALKALLPMYAGRVKCVYIDPPYNTGNEKWAYNDNVASPMMQDWLGKVVDRDDLTRHDKWLCMMTPRLKLLWELLADDGAIFVSIDDNEVHHLRALMDEVFGDDNFITSIVWQKSDSPKNTAIHLSEDHEYILIYAKNSDIWRPLSLPRSDAMVSRYKNPDNDHRGPWLLSDLAARNYYEYGRYPIKTPAGRVIQGPPAGSYWRVSKERFKELEKDNRIWWGAKGNNRPGIKRFLSEVREGVVPQTLWQWRDVGSTRHSKQELSNVMEGSPNEDLFITPKPSKLIARILQIATSDNSIILDSFAGSGTTAHAVLKQNQQDGGNRRFILIECEDYADSITAERVRRVIKGVPKAKDDALRAGLGGSFSFFKLGKAIEPRGMLDGSGLPSYNDLARYVFYTATGEEFDPAALDRKTGFIGESAQYRVYLFYEPDVKTLRDLAFTLEMARALPARKEGQRHLVFAPTKYLDAEQLAELSIDFAQLPFEIYERAR